MLLLVPITAIWRGHGFSYSVKQFSDSNAAGCPPNENGGKYGKDRTRQLSGRHAIGCSLDELADETGNHEKVIFLGEKKPGWRPRLKGFNFMSDAIIHKNPHKSTLSIYFIDLTASAINAQTIAVRRNYGQTAKFWGYYPLTWRQHRHTTGGFFTSVECERGFMLGVRRLQDDENRNKRVVFQESHSSARQLLPTTKTQLGAVIMTAKTHPMGNPARRAPAHLTTGGVA